jgi:hypothetical protein
VPRVRGDGSWLMTNNPQNLRGRQYRKRTSASPIWEAPMHQFDLLDAPTLAQIDYYYIEDAHNWVDLCWSFAHFRWHDQDYWLLGQMRGHGMMAAGSVLLRLPRRRKIYEAGLVVHPHVKPVTFSVRPFRSEAWKHRQFVFAGFHPQRVVNIDFVRAEDRRIRAMPSGAARERLSRPPPGHVV